MSIIQKLKFSVSGDGRGNLISLEENKNIPFDIKRVYYITDMKSESPRGFHAHKKLMQVAICVSGSCKMILDNGTVREETILQSPSEGLLIKNMIWREMHDFSKDCVLMVIASQYYDESDYIRDYQLFLKASLEHKND